LVEEKKGCRREKQEGKKITIGAKKEKGVLSHTKKYLWK